MELQELKDAVVKALVVGFDLNHEEATEEVNQSFNDKPHLWHENSDAEELAAMLANEGDDD
jgi:hypothetical protein